MSGEFERRVQDSLRVHAADAPSSDSVVDRVLVSVNSEPPGSRDRPRWRSFTGPVLAAAAVVVIAVGAVLVTRADGRTTHTASPHTQISRSAVPSTSPTPGPALPSVSPSPSTSSAATPSLRDVHVLDMTFTASDNGWALASVQCADDPSRRCTAILRSTGGSSWTGDPGKAPFRVAGVAGRGPIVEHLRFATDAIGYAFGPNALFMTADGGRTWLQQPAGALGLETANGNVVRLVARARDVQVQTASIGSSAWSARALGAAPGAGANGVTMSRTEGDVFVLLTGVRHGSPWTASLFRSGDDGHTWQPVSDPCPYPGGYEPTQVAAGTGGRVAVTCRLPQTTEARLAISTDAGTTFADRGVLPQRSGLLAVGRPGVYLLALDGLSRTTDSGGRWNFVAGMNPGFTWLGFESDAVGRIVADGGATIWTTRDGGNSWNRLELP